MHVKQKKIVINSIKKITFLIRNNFQMNYFRNELEINFQLYREFFSRERFPIYDDFLSTIAKLNHSEGNHSSFSLSQEN